MRRIAFLVIATIVALPALGLAQEVAAHVEMERGPHKIVTSDAITYEPIEVPGFDPGMEIAVLHGDPMGEAGDYTLRLKFPDGYRFPAHYHPRAEHVTVFSGTFLLAMGEVENYEAVKTYAPGSFLYIPAEDPHYGGATGETVIQLHGEAPFEIVLVDPVS
jgi:quercetin dioxygenase-like cupin family protein